MKIIFFGTPEFVIPVANSILNTENLKLVAVVTNPDRAVGRHQILTPSPIKQWATQHNIPVLTPNILDDGFKFQVSSFKPQVGILAAYGKIIPKEIIDLFPKGILVIHPSLLPIYRGASPIQAAILSGDQETGVSIIQMDEKMDHGPIFTQFKEEIKPDDTDGTLTKRLFEKTAELLPIVFRHPEFSSGSVPQKSRILKQVQNDDRLELFFPPRSQNHSLATYTKLLTKDDGFLNLASQGQALRAYNFIRAMSPWPGAWTMVNCHSRSNRESSVSQRHSELVSESALDPRFRGDDNKLRLKILKAHLEKEKLILDEVQLEGKKPISWKQFQKAYPDFSLVKTG